MRFSLRFSFDRGEELRGHHLGGSLNHSLSDSRDRPANLNVASVVDGRDTILLGEIEVARSFQKSRLALTLDDDPVMFRRTSVFDLDASREEALDGTYTGF